MAEAASSVSTRDIYQMEKTVRSKTHIEMQSGLFVVYANNRDIEFSSLSMNLISLPWTPTAQKTMLEYAKAHSKPCPPSKATIQTLLFSRTLTKEIHLLLDTTLDTLDDQVTKQLLHFKIQSLKKTLPLELYLPLVGYSLKDEDYLEEAPPIDFSSGDLVSIHKDGLPEALTGIVLEIKEKHAIVRINSYEYFKTKRETLRWLKPSYKRKEKQACIDRYQASLDKCAVKCLKPPPQVGGATYAESNFPVVLLSSDEDAVVFSLDKTDLAFTDVSKIERVRAVLQAHNEDVEVYSIKMFAQFKHTK